MKLKNKFTKNFKSKYYENVRAHKCENMRKIGEFHFGRIKQESIRFG